MVLAEVLFRQGMHTHTHTPLSTYLPTYLSTHLPTCLPTYLPGGQEEEAMKAYAKALHTLTNTGLHVSSSSKIR